MKKLALSLMFCASAAFATTVTYTTAGVFTNSGTNTSTAGGATLTFAGITTPDSADAPTFSSLGTITVSGTSPGIFSDTFTLTITQTVPSSGTGSSSSSVSGLITGSSSGINLVFVPADVIIGSGATAVDYRFLNGSYGLAPPNSNGGVTSLQVQILALPEPATLGLMGMSLLGLGVLVRRRVKK